MTHPCVGTELALRVFSPELGTAENRRSTVLPGWLDAPCVGAHPNAPVPLSDDESTGKSGLASRFSIFVQNWSKAKTPSVVVLMGCRAVRLPSEGSASGQSLASPPSLCLSPLGRNNAVKPLGRLLESTEPWCIPVRGQPPTSTLPTL